MVSKGQEDRVEQDVPIQTILASGNSNSYLVTSSDVPLENPLIKCIMYTSLVFTQIVLHACMFTPAACLISSTGLR